MGNLAVSRALGDFSYKYSADSAGKRLAPGLQMVSCVPVITVLKRPAEFTLILACDGIWDVMSNAETATFIWDGYGKDKKQKKETGKSAAPTLQNLLKTCLQKESKDNMSVILVE